MTQKLSFSVEDAKMINENPDSNFAVMSLDFFASGKNLHDMYVSEETLLKTADSIKNCPLVWKYDDVLDDIYTHDKDEVPCGFVPENSEIQQKKLPDGRTMLSVVAYVWKKYTGELLSFFKRDGGKKPVSVEMSVFNSKLLPNGLTELVDYRYEGITVLGSFVTPAIPLANASVLSFSKIKEEYEKDFEKEFSYINADMKIPEAVKSNAIKGLELRKIHNSAGTSVGLSFAKYLTKSEKISPDKARYIVEYFSKHKGVDFQQEDPPSDSYISSLLLGGITAWKWAQSIVDAIDKEEKKMAYSELVTFPYNKREDMNPALKGINPPITAAQGSEIAKQADAIGTDGKTNGWAIAISSFKKTHVVKDGKWVKKKTEEMEMDNMEIEKKEEMSAEDITMAEDEKKEEAEVKEMAEEKPAPSEEKLPPEGKEEKKFEFPKNMSLEKMAELFSDDGDEDDIKMAKEEIAKEEMSVGWAFANPAVLMSGMFAKMCKMAAKIAEMAEEKKVYMEENENLKKFKFDFDAQKKSFEVDKTMKELSEKVIIPDEAKEEMIAESQKYSVDNINEWKTYCKAKSFDFATKESSKTEVVRMGLPFTATALKKTDDLWADPR